VWERRREYTERSTRIFCESNRMRKQRKSNGRITKRRFRRGLKNRREENATRGKNNLPYRIENIPKRKKEMKKPENG